jgi:hypothetical protein
LGKVEAMSLSDELRDWWTETLLEQQMAVHPILGREVTADVQGDTVTLSGEVETVDDAQRIEEEARSLQSIERVVNRLRVVGSEETQHLQTIIAVFADSQSARLGAGTVASWKWREDREPDIIDHEAEAERALGERAAAAQVPRESVQEYIEAVRSGKSLLLERVPEDDAFQVLSALEGAQAEKVSTLPPEPDTVVTD